MDSYQQGSWHHHERSVRNQLTSYDIEIVKNNQIYDVSTDANTGKVLSSQVDMEDED